MTNEKLSGIVYAFIIVIVGVVLIGVIADQVWLNNNMLGGTNASSVNIASLRTGSQVGELNASKVTCTVGAGNMSQYPAGYYCEPYLTLPDQCIHSFTGAVWSNGTALTRYTDYNVTLSSTGTSNFVLYNSSMKFINASNTNTTLWTYSYGCNYINDSASRTIMGLIVLFFVLGLVAIVIALTLRKNGIIDF